jgi:hypothetical protein
MFTPAVHEMITQQALQESHADEGAGQGHHGAQALGYRRAFRLLIEGTTYPDKPEGMIKLGGIYGRHKGGTLTEDDKKSLTYRSHYGDLQIWHSMAPPGMTRPKDIRAAILAEAGKLYDEATNPEGTDESRANALGTILHMIQDGYSPAHVERDTETGEIIKFNDYSQQDPAEHAEAEKVGGGVADSERLYDAVKKDPNTRKAVNASADALRAFKSGSRDKFMDSVKKNFKVKKTE